MIPQSAVPVDPSAARDRRAFEPRDERQLERRDMRLDVPADEQAREREAVKLNQ